jgi:AhpD family alkylhydroperoxidase
MTPRIAPGTRHDIGFANWLAIEIGGRVARTGSPNLFTTMARNRGLFRAWLVFAGRLMPRGSLARRDTELVILRTAALSGCDYEIDHHRRLGAGAGLSPAEIDRIVDLATDGWPERDNALLTAADRLHRDRDLDDETWRELRRQLSESEAIEFLLLAGHYTMLATFITTSRIELDHAAATPGQGSDPD